MGSSQSNEPLNVFISSTLVTTQRNLEMCHPNGEKVVVEEFVDGGRYEGVHFDKEVAT